MVAVFFTCLLPLLVLLLTSVFTALHLLQADVDLLFPLLLQPPQLLLSLTPLLQLQFLTKNKLKVRTDPNHVFTSKDEMGSTFSSSSALLCSFCWTSCSDKTTCSGSRCRPEKRFSSSASFLALYVKTQKHTGHLHRLLESLEVINYSQN